MAYTVYLKRSAEKELKELPAKTHDKIIDTLLSLEDNPFPRNAKSFRDVRASDYESACIGYSTSLTMRIKR